MHSFHQSFNLYCQGRLQQFLNLFVVCTEIKGVKADI
jgi:hypothetical protein